MSDGLVSVVMPAFNAGTFLEDAVQSIRAQTYPSWELFIVDDCSSDGTAENAMKWSSLDSRIKVLRTEKNSGSSVARNLGVSSCSGEYLAFIDADDVWLPGKLEKQVAFMRTRNADFSFTAYRKFEAQRQGAVMPARESVSWREMLKSNVIGCSTVMLAFRQFQNIRFPVGLDRQEDYALWLQLLRTAQRAYGLNEVLTLYRIHSASKSTQKFRSIVAQWEVYRRFEKLSFLLSGWYLGQYAVRGLLKYLR
jgi:teichuronic acid biosynthesis glycosyltransferase TuaG